MSTNVVKLYTDGSSENPGRGGWAYKLVFADGSEKVASGNCDMTTNNRMEMLAVIKGLEEVRSMDMDCSIEIYTDSPQLIK